MVPTTNSDKKIYKIHDSAPVAPALVKDWAWTYYMQAKNGRHAKLRGTALIYRQITLNS